MPGLVRALRAGKRVSAPGYDAVTRAAGDVLTYEPTGQAVIVLDGVFAGHPSVRKMLDFVVFAIAPDEVIWTRFRSFYRWKGLDEDAIEALWRERCIEEWSAVDRQRDSADFIASSGRTNS
jgi:uridine kinase